MTEEERRREAEHIAEEGARKAKAARGKRKPKAANGEPPPAPPVLEEHPTNGVGVDWKEQALKTDRGAPMAIYANAVLALESEPAFAGMLGFDEFSYKTTLRRKLPDDPKGFVVPRELTDLDVLSIQGMLQWRGLPRISRQTTEDAVQTVAKAHRIHPLRDWLGSLHWGGEPLLPVWLTKAAGAPDDEYHKQVGTLFITAMVARVMQPGCKCDYMPVLEGKQGILKSSLCRELAGEEYFSDQLPSQHFDGVRFSMHLRGKWLLELSELASIAKSEIEELKSMLVRRVEEYIPKYGRRLVHEPRQCAFIGTTNRDDYSRDETGARRFWPVKTGRIDLGWLREHREQLFAEAVERFNRGLPWWPERAIEESHFAPQQQDRYGEDIWTPKVVEQLGKLEAVAKAELEHTPLHLQGPVPVAETTLADVALAALDLPIGKLGRAEQLRLAAIFLSAGWSRGKRNAHARPWVKELATRPAPEAASPPP